MRRRHFLADLPLLVKIEVFKYIDYETRTRLRGLSRRTREMIDTLPLVLDWLETSVDPFYIDFRERRNGTLHLVNLSSKPWTFFWEILPVTRNWVDEISIQTAFEKLAVILRNPNLRIRKLAVGAYGQFQHRLKVTREDIHLSLNLLKLILGSLHHQLRVRTFAIHFESGEHEVAAFLPHLQPGYLKSLELWTRRGGVPGYEQILRMEQWKRLEHLHVKNPPPTLSIEDFWHIPKVRLGGFKMRKGELDRLINHYLNHDEFQEAVFEGVHDRWVPTTRPESDTQTLHVRNPDGQRLGVEITQNLHTGNVVMQRK